MAALVLLLSGALLVFILVLLHHLLEVDPPALAKCKHELVVSHVLRAVLVHRELIKLIDSMICTGQEIVAEAIGHSSWPHLIRLIDVSLWIVHEAIELVLLHVVDLDHPLEYAVEAHDLASEKVLGFVILLSAPCLIF